MRVMKTLPLAAVLLPARILAQRRSGDGDAHAAALCVSAARGLQRYRQHRSGGEFRVQVTGRWLVASALVVASLGLGATSPALTRSFDAATDAWERGDYSTALSGYIQVVSAPGGDAFFEPIALTTGELFETRELTADGRAPRFSPDNKYIAYETGLETSRRTRVVRNDRRR